MKSLLISLSVLGTLSSAASYSVDQHGATLSSRERAVARLLARALPANAPHGYTPQTIDCPTDAPTIRSAATLSTKELDWLPVRRNATVAPMRNLLKRMNITGLDTDSYIDKYKDDPRALPNIAIAISGGGYRAMLNGAGVLEAFDGRTEDATAAGRLGGLLQSTTYLAGLSGGSWLVGSLYTNNFTSVQKILAKDTPAKDSGGLWQLDNSIFEGPATSGLQVIDTAEYYADLIEDVDDKSDAGFAVTITDYWGRALSYQLVNASQGGPAYTFSSIAEQEFFTDGGVPLPFLVADYRHPGQDIASINSTVFSITPWELGSEDPTVYGFAPLKYIGTDFDGGSPVSKKCVVGFDNVGFVMGTSSSLFGEAFIEVNSTETTGLISTALKDALVALLAKLGKTNYDIADWVNPFYGYHNATNTNAPYTQLTLVDGGEDLQNIPFHPLIQPNRHVDVIFAVDSSADTNSTYPTDSSAENWPAGISMVATYERSLSAIQNGTAFPSVPDTNTFINLGLNNRPTFFGCDLANLSGPAPLIVYLPNAPYVYDSNVSTLDLQYADAQRDAIVLNGYDLATQGNASLDADWPACVGCAVLHRSLHRTGTDVPAVCKSCFKRYCWNGTVESRTPDSYVPSLKIVTKAKRVDESRATELGAPSLVLLVSVLMASFLLL